MPGVTPVAEEERDPAAEESAQRPPSAAPPAPPGTDASQPPPARPPKPPGSYNPDLRPMLILAALLVGVIIGWLVLSPIILPGR